MIRIIFKNGSIIDCENVAKVFIDKKDFDEKEKVIIVGCISGPKLETGDKNETMA